jgi:hypothetical protein
MKTLIKQNQMALDLAVFFASPAGAVGSALLLIIADCVMNAFAIGEIFGARMMGLVDGEGINWIAFVFAMFITLGLSFSQVAAFILLKIDVLSIASAEARTSATKANDKLDFLGNMLCNFSSVISLMSVGIYLFKGVSYTALLVMLTTPIFYCKLILFLPIAIGVPRAISGFARYIYSKYNDLLVDANKIIIDKAKDAMREYVEPTTEEGSESEEEGISAKIKRLKRTRLKTA